MTAADYRRRAEQHRPTDPLAIGAEMRRLAAGGLRPQDISQVLRVHLGQVLEALAEPPSPPPLAAAKSPVLRATADGVGRSSLNLTKGAFP